MNSAVSVAALCASAALPGDEALDSRRPLLLDHHGYVLQVIAGHADIFAVDVKDGKWGSRHQLFRVEAGDIVPDLPSVVGSSANGLCFIAAGAEGARVSLIRRSELQSMDLAIRWIERLARFVAGSTPRWQMAELPEGEGELDAGECRRGPMRGLVWLTVNCGGVRLMGVGAPCVAGNHPLPLTSALWVEAAEEGCAASITGQGPADDQIWTSIDQFHPRAVEGVQDILAREAQSAVERLTASNEARGSQDGGSLRSPFRHHREADLDNEAVDASQSDRLAGACQIVGNAMRAPIAISGRIDGTQHDFAALSQIAHGARLRIREVLLRSEWWRSDAGPLVGWYGEKRDPVALVYEPGRGYVMIDPLTKLRRPVDRALAMQIAPEAVMFYPSLPSRSLKFRDLLQFSLRFTHGNISRIAVTVALIGLLSLVTPFVTDILISSIIPRSELDQLAFCAMALALTAASIAGIQVMQGFVMLRLEATIDWRLQSALIDRLLRLPTSIFREFTAGDLVDRSMGIDAARRALTGRALRGMIAGLFCFFSLGLMIYYDFKLALIAIALTSVRAIAIISADLVRLRFEGKHFNQQGKVSGFVLQLLTGVGKLRVSAATERALGIWSKQFATQKQYFVSSQVVGNGLSAFETAFPTIATLIIFAYASYSVSKLMTDIGTFFAFFAAFGQTLGSVGAWAAGISEALIAIPPLRRLGPLIKCPTEVSEERKSPGELSGIDRTCPRVDAISRGRASRARQRHIEDHAGRVCRDRGTFGKRQIVLVPASPRLRAPGSGRSALRRQIDRDAGRERRAASARRGAAERRSWRTETSTRTSAAESGCRSIRFGRPRIWRALKTISGPCRWACITQLSEGVSTLSGGQRQRIMIARAIARRPRILLFDEATSSLDNQSQAIVSDALENLNVTRIAIAHRLSTVQRADRIIVLVSGRIVQTGTFSELSTTPGVFQSFAKRQML